MSLNNLPAVTIRSLFPWAVALGGLLLTQPAVLAQDWKLSGAPSASWSSIASSADGNKLVATTYTGAIYQSTNAGSTWFASAAPSKAWVSVASSADGTKLVAGAGYLNARGQGGVCVSADSGATWTTVRTNDGPYFVACSADGMKLLAGETDRDRDLHMLISADMGATWTYPDGPTRTKDWPGADQCYVASSADGTKLVAATMFSGGIFTSQDSGVTWTKTSARLNNWNSIASSADGNRLVAASDMGVYLSADGGLTWNPAGLPRYPFWVSGASSADGSRLVVLAPGSLVYTSSDAGLSWQKASLPHAPWQAAASSADGGKLAIAVYSAQPNGTDPFNACPIFTLQTTPPPALALQPAEDQAVVLSWTVPSANFNLQRKDALEASDWREVTNSSYFDHSRLEYRVSVPRPDGPAFFRLQTP